MHANFHIIYFFIIPNAWFTLHWEYKQTELEENDQQHTKIHVIYLNFLY